MNQIRARKFFQKLFPDYRHRWEIYNDVLLKLITKETVWLDIGCGINGHVAEFGKLTKTAIGIDIIDRSDRIEAPFLKADIRKIPLPDSIANLITLRMIVEHLQCIPQDFSEVDRLLAPGGILLIMTTNSLSPVIFIPRLFPFPLKRWLV